MHVTRGGLSLLASAKRRVVNETGLSWMGLTSKKVSTGQSSSGATGKLNSRRLVGVRRTRQYRYVNRPLVGQENQRPWSLKHGQRRGTCLPSWYPRTPLRDITAIVRAIERKRAKLRDDQGETSQTDTDVLAPKTNLESEINISTSNSLPNEILSENVNEKGKDDETCNPENTLVNPIEEARKLWLEEQQRLEETLLAKEAERKRKNRVLRSMR